MREGLLAARRPRAAVLVGYSSALCCSWAARGRGACGSRGRSGAASRSGASVEAPLAACAAEAAPAARAAAQAARVALPAARAASAALAARAAEPAPHARLRLRLGVARRLRRLSRRRRRRLTRRRRAAVDHAAAPRGGGARRRTLRRAHLSPGLFGRLVLLAQRRLAVRARLHRATLPSRPPGAGVAPSVGPVAARIGRSARKDGGRGGRGRGGGSGGSGGALRGHRRPGRKRQAVHRSRCGSPRVGCARGRPAGQRLGAGRGARGAGRARERGQCAWRAARCAPGARSPRAPPRTVGHGPRKRGGAPSSFCSARCERARCVGGGGRGRGRRARVSDARRPRALPVEKAAECAGSRPGAGRRAPRSSRSAKAAAARRRAGAGEADGRGGRSERGRGRAGLRERE